MAVANQRACNGSFPPIADPTPALLTSAAVRIAARICEAIGLILVIFIVVFTDYIDNNRPSHPVGRFVVPEENHGEHIFISQTDRSITRGAWVAFFAILVVGMALEGLRSGDR
jgi:hypothetical protein